MKIKLHIGVLVVLMAFLGTFFETSATANQQIVIQFLDKDIAKDASESAIESVKKLLQSLGAALIKINKNKAGQLVITYYSETDVEHIQNVLSAADDFKLANDSDHKGTKNGPKRETVKAYKLDITEIQTNNPIHWNFEKTEIVELNQTGDYSGHFKINFSGVNFSEHPTISKIKVALQNNTSVLFTIDAQFYKIPQVRAGPYLAGMS